VVGAYNTSGGVSNIYTRSATGVVTKLPLPSGLKSTGTVPVAINNSGTITGYYTVKGGQYYGFTGSGTTFAKIADGSAYYTEPAAINAGGEIVGASLPQSGASESAFVDVGGVVSDLPTPSGTTFLAATGVNDLGEVIGNADLTSGFTAVNGVVSLFGIAGSSAITPTAINDSGEVAGNAIVGGQTLGFLYNGTTATTFSVPGAVGTDPLAINAAGEVVGYYTDSSGNDHGFLATPVVAAVPEPASTTLLIAGVGGAVLMRRRCAGCRSPLPRHRA
jgi:probable HAF family extracellular repeat protein